MYSPNKTIAKLDGCRYRDNLGKDLSTSIPKEKIMELYQMQMDHNVFARHRAQIRDQEKIGPDEKMEFAQDVDALVSLARARVSLIVSPPLEVSARRLVHAIVEKQNRSAAMFDRTLPLNGQELAYELTIIA